MNGLKDILDQLQGKQLRQVWICDVSIKYLHLIMYYYLLIILIKSRVKDIESSWLSSSKISNLKLVYFLNTCYEENDRMAMFIDLRL